MTEAAPKTIKITDIVPARYNPRKISNEEYNKLSNSINEFGLVDPIIINLNNNHIIGGHQRYDVLMDEHISGNEDYEELILIERGDIGWVFPNEQLEIKDLNHEKTLNIALNRITGFWDPEKLEDLFNDLSIEGADLQLTGFDKEELKDIAKGIDLNNFGESLQDDLTDSFADEPTTSSNSNDVSSTTRTRREHTCPSCGYTFLEGEETED